MTFFDHLLGFPETDGEEIRAQLELDGTRLTSLANGQSYECGELTTPSLAELRALPLERTGELRVQELVGDVRALHADPANAGAFFQVASQFNLLEMVGPSRTPEEGVGIYERDRTQGPACAIACGAGTIYRNWLVPVGDQFGQTHDQQIDCLADLGEALGGELWDMENGYALATASGLRHIRGTLEKSTTAQRDALMGHLRIGLHSRTEVTIHGAGHLVTQAYCSALPVAYSSHLVRKWEPFARLVLDASYEATMLVASRNAQDTGNNLVFLTMIGGGAFGNRTEWIVEAMARALERVKGVELDVRIVSFGSPTAALQAVVS